MFGQQQAKLMNIYKKIYMLIACFVFPICGMQPITYDYTQGVESKISQGTFHDVSASILRQYHNNLTDSVLRIVDYAYANFPKDKTIPHMSVARIIICCQNNRKVCCDLPYIFLSRDTVKNFTLSLSKMTELQIDGRIFEAIQDNICYALDSGGAKSQSPAAQSHSERSIISCLANDQTFFLNNIIAIAGVARGDIRSIIIESRNFFKPCPNCIAFLQTRSRVKYDTLMQKYVYVSMQKSFPVQDETYTAEQTIYEWMSSKNNQLQIAEMQLFHRTEMQLLFFFDKSQSGEQINIGLCTFGHFLIFI